MAPFDTSDTTYFWSSIVGIALSCTILELFDVTLKSGLSVTQGH